MDDISLAICNGGYSSERGKLWLSLCFSFPGDLRKFSTDWWFLLKIRLILYNAILFNFGKEIEKIKRLDWKEK